MGDITVTAAQVAPLYPDGEKGTIIVSKIAAVTITKGQAVYYLTTGTCGVADANDAGKQQFRGIALNGGGAGQAIDVLEQGFVAGFTLTGNADTIIYLSDTAGALGDANGTMNVKVGRVQCLSDKSLTKVLYVRQWPTADWS